VTVAGSAMTPACLVPGLGVSGAYPTLTVYDKSLDGLDNEYVLVSQPGNARTTALLEQRDWRGGAGVGVGGALATAEVRVNMYIYIYIYIYIYMYKYMFVYVCLYIYIYVCVRVNLTTSTC